MKNNVYDIINAGPNHRFTVRDTEGRSFLVSNCVQAIAGRILREIILEINKPGTIDVWTNTHDECPAMINDCEDIARYVTNRNFNQSVEPDKRIPNPLPTTPEVELIKAAMTRERAYMPGLPLAIEYDFGYRYGDCK